MIHPSVVEGTLRVYFPTSGAVGSVPDAARPGPMTMVDSCAGELLANVIPRKAVELINNHASSVMDEDSARHSNLVRGWASKCCKVNFVKERAFVPEKKVPGSFVGWTSGVVYLSSEALSATELSANIASIRNHLHYITGGVPQAAASTSLASPSIQARLHLTKMKSYERGQSRRKALDYMYDFLEDAFEEKNLSMLDALLEGASVEFLDSTLSVSLLRATSRAKKSLVNWRLYKFKVIESLQEDPSRGVLLRGID
ncbi:hypothetical protein NRB16_03985 [Pseudomonas sp. LJDD11]|uniref:hypothetical protein n=1 Tax=Pseudomonas sp. LJDD11 TaxID=2931984 RepID=UPI00211B9000|nr:hypothetical protein [Pseudomonas sp. LJDD11]MCQ9422691.1 hypothetical protein [Pseudomonas sp. LJDD11]